MNNEERAEIMARLVVMQKTASAPKLLGAVIKRADINPALIGGLGGAALLGGADYLTNRDPKKALTSALMGGGLGAIGGYSYGNLAANGGGNPITGANNYINDLQHPENAHMQVKNPDGSTADLTASSLQGDGPSSALGRILKGALPPLLTSGAINIRYPNPGGVLPVSSGLGSVARLGANAGNAYYNYGPGGKVRNDFGRMRHGLFSQPAATTQP